MTSAHFILTLCILAAGSGLWITIAGRPLRGLCLAIFASAVLLAPRLPVVRDKVGLCEVVMLLTWAAMLYRRPPGVPLFAEQKTAIWRGALLIGACLCSFGVNAAAGDLSLERSGVETANYVYGFLLFVTTIRLVDSWEKWVACFFAWFWGTALVSAVAVATLAGRGPASARDEFTGRIYIHAEILQSTTRILPTRFYAGSALDGDAGHSQTHSMGPACLGNRLGPRRNRLRQPHRPAHAVLVRRDGDLAESARDE